MRMKAALIGVAGWAVVGCADTAPPRLGYAPPADPPETPAAGFVGGPSADLIWNQLLDRLDQAGLEVDLADRERGVMVATYSGDPAPYVTCGWILLYGEGEPEQIDASGDASVQRMVRGRAVEIGRDLKLDARLVVEVRPGGREAFVDANANYVLTKTVVAADRSGRQRGRSYEIVSFSTGERGAFSKGTLCQPNGDLERTVLDIVPPKTRIAGAAERTRPSATRRSTIVQTELASNNVFQQPATTDDAGRKTGASNDLAEPSSATDGREQQALPSNEPHQPAAASAVEPRQPSACAIADTTFCAVLDVTEPYRRANEERGFGLEVKRIAAGSPLVDGSGLGLDISLPGYEAYLAVSYFLRDGTVHHVLPGRNRRWPGNAVEFLGGPGLGADQSGEVEMVVAVASEEPLFQTPRPTAEAAEDYLADLRARLAEMSGASKPARIAASVLVVTPALPQPS